MNLYRPIALSTLLLTAICWSCRPRLAAAVPAFSEKTTLSTLIQEFRERANGAEEGRFNSLSYHRCQRKRNFLEAGLLGGTCENPSPNGCIQACMDGGLLSSLEFRCTSGRRPGLFARYIYLESGTVIVPSVGEFASGDTIFATPLIASSPFPNCFIVPFPGDSMHLLIRTLLRPNFKEFRDIEISDITSIHLIGNDLETRCMIRFENGKEYFAASYSGFLNTVEYYFFQRNKGIQVNDLASMELCQILGELYSIAASPVPPDALKGQEAVSAQFIWEWNQVVSGAREFFLDRIIDSQKPYPLED